MSTKQAITVYRTPPVVGRKGRLEGVDYKFTDELVKSGATHKVRRPTVEELERVWALVERNFDASSEIRRKAGLPQLEPNFYAQALWEAMELRSTGGAGEGSRAEGSEASADTDPLGARREAEGRAGAQAGAGEAVLE